MPVYSATRLVVRRAVVLLALVGIAVVGGLSVAGCFRLAEQWRGGLAPWLITPLVGLLGAVLFWPAWLTLRGWATVPRLENCRRALNQAIAALPSTTETQALAETIADLCHRLLPGRAVALLLPEQRSELLTAAAVAGPNAGALQGMSLSRRSALARALEHEGRPLVVTRWLEGPDGAEAPGSSDTVAPLCVRGNLVGALVLGRDARGHTLSREEAAVAMELCDQSAGALENAQLYGSLRAAFADLETAQRELLALQRATTAAQSSLNLQEVLRNVCNGVIESMDYEEAIVYLVDTVTKALSPSMAAGRTGAPKLRQHAETADARPLRLDFNKPATRALLRHEIVINHDPANSILPLLVDGGSAGRRELMQERTVVNVPLVANGEVVGGMALVTRRRSPTERELDSLRGFAAQAASAIVNARLYEDLRDAYNDIRIAQDELVRTERLRTLGELASSVAHDFNNILLAILTHAQLGMRQSDGGPLQNTLGIIEQAARDGSEVVRRIQNLARTKSPETADVVELGVLLRQSMEMTQPVWKALADGRGDAIEAHFEEGPVGRITGVSSELREVFTNLLMNAVQAMPRGGHLSLRTFIKDGHAWAEVQDTGIGMSPDVRKRLYEPFFTTKGSAGSGLGMSIVSSIVQRHAGIIEIDSAPGEGSTVAVGFPLLVAAQPKREPPAGRRVQVREPLSILVVDDDQRAANALRLVLESLGHCVTVCADGHEALRIFLDGDFRVLFTDLSIGALSGWDVAKAVKKMRPTTTVILVTGWAAQLDVADPSSRGVDQVLAKPFSLDEVAASLERGPHRAAAPTPLLNSATGSAPTPMRTERGA